MSKSNLGFLATPTPSGDGATPASPEARSDQFVAVSGPETEQVNASAMVIVAYGLFWLMAFAFVYFTYRGQVRLAARVAEIEKRLPKDHQVS